MPRKKNGPNDGKGVGNRGAQRARSSEYKEDPETGKRVKYRKKPADSPPSLLELDMIPNYKHEPERARVWAKAEYLSGKNSIEWIAHWGNIPGDVIQRWVFLGRKEGANVTEFPWANERNALVVKAVQGVLANLSDKIGNCFSHCVWMIGETLNRYSEQNREFTLSEIKQITLMAGQLQSMMHISRGEPAKMFGLDINVNKGNLTWDMIKERIKENDILAWDEKPKGEAIATEGIAVLKPKTLDQKELEYVRRVGREARDGFKPDPTHVRIGNSREAEPATQGEAVSCEAEIVIQCDIPGRVQESVHRQGPEGGSDGSGALHPKPDSGAPTT